MNLLVWDVRTLSCIDVVIKAKTRAVCTSDNPSACDTSLATLLHSRNGLVTFAYAPGARAKS
jgi:hypothetical protein